MTPHDLISEGEAIAKKCFLLTPNACGDVVGYWGGTRSDIPDSFPPVVTKFASRRHIVSVAESLLKQLDIDRLGPTSIYEWEDLEGDFHLNVERDHQKRFEDFTCSGQPLYATEARSFPPIEALCLHGSHRVADWLSSLGLARHEYWKVPRTVTSEYEAHYRQHSPLMQNSAYVVVGGWHMMWPEDDYYMPPEMSFVMLTLRDAEPWYSVWYSPMSQACFARQHVT